MDRRIIIPPVMTVLLLLNSMIYYGFRAVMILYCVDVLQLPDNNAFGLYNQFTLLVFFLPLFGGIIADLLVSRRIMLVTSSVLSIIGFLLLSGGNEVNLPWFIGIIALGTCVTKVMLLAGISDSFPSRNHTTEGWTMMTYMAVNIGAVISVVLFPYIASEYTYETSFTLAALIGIPIALGSIATVFLYSRPLAPLVNYTEFLALKEDVKVEKGIAFTGIVLGFNMLYWATYSAIFQEYSLVIEESIQSVFSSITPIATITAVAVLGILHFTKMLEKVQFLLIGIGMTLMSVAYVICLTFSSTLGYILCQVFLIISEPLCHVMLLGLILRVAPRKFLGIALGFYMFSFINFYDYINILDFLSSISALILFGLGICSLIFYKKLWNWLFTLNRNELSRDSHQEG